MSLNSREDIQAREAESLAGYARLSSESRGRVYPQPPHPFRTIFQRDRDRIIHSSAFRRMEYKTQVFLPHEGDHLRTRLTHTIEVAQVSRTMARCLRLNEDLTEAIALVHDLGHTPFGHAGEDVLDELLAEQGGFNHNRQSLRVVDLLEERYPDHPGLNLSYDVREGIVKHETKVPIKHPDFDDNLRPSLEASLVDLADEIAYNGHDIDDGIRAGLIRLDEVAGLDIWQALGQVEPLLRGGAAPFLKLSDDIQRFTLVRSLVNLMATDVLKESERQLEKLNIIDRQAVDSAAEKVCRYSVPMEEMIGQLKRFLKERVYCHETLLARSAQAEEVIRAIYLTLLDQPGQMPERYQKMLDQECLEIVVADYLAGMTDRFAEECYRELAS